MDGWDQVLGLCATKYPGKPFEGQENECTNQCLSKPPWQAMPLPHIRRQRFFHHLRIQHQVDDRVPTDGGFGKEQAGNLWYIYKSQDRSLEKTHLKTEESMTWRCNKSFCIITKVDNTAAMGWGRYVDRITIKQETWRWLWPCDTRKGKPTA